VRLRFPTWTRYARFCRVNWVLLFLLAGVALAGVLAIAAVIAAGGSDRASEGSDAERAAIWQAGFAPEDLRVLAGLAAVARVDLAAAQIEVVLWHGSTGVVVTGSRLPPGRLGATVQPGDGVAGRALAAGRTIVGGVGAAGDTSLVAIAAPIPAADGIAGVVAATAGGLFGATDVPRLEALAADAGRRLTPDASGIRHTG
jgi:hypothetical protein